MGRRAAQAVRARCRAAIRLSRDAFARLQAENKHLSAEQARHLPEQGVAQSEGRGPLAGSSTRSMRVNPPFDLRFPETPGAVGAHYMRWHCSSMERKTGPQSGEGRPARAFQDGQGRRVRRRTMQPAVPPHVATRGHFFIKSQIGIWPPTVQTLDHGRSVPACLHPPSFHGPGWVGRMRWGIHQPGDLSARTPGSRVPGRPGGAQAICGIGPRPLSPGDF